MRERVKSMVTGLPLKLWTIDDYEEMIERGILDADDRVELIRGEIVEMTPIGFRHVNCVINLDALFHRLPENEVTVSIQNPLQLPNDSEPQPDVVLLKGYRSLYAGRRATSEDALLVVDVSDATLKPDKNIKLPLYAEAGIPEAWIVNLEEDVIEVYSEPVGGEYRKMRIAGKGESVNLPGGLAGVVSVGEVVG
jgi:Uma2 family endonuclease